MEAKIITITPLGKRKIDSCGWHTASLKAFDTYDDAENDNPKYERTIDSFNTIDVKFDFEPNGKCIRLFPYSLHHNMLEFDETYGPTIKGVYVD